MSGPFKLTSGLSLLEPREKRGMLLLGIVIALSGFLETVAIGSTVPLITFVLEPAKLDANKYYQFIFQLLGQPSRDAMATYLSAATLSILIVSAAVTLTVNHASARFSGACWRRLSNDLMRESIDTPYEWFLSRNSSTLTRLFYHDVPLWSRDVVSHILNVFSDIVVFVFIGGLVIAVFPIEGIWAVLIAFLLGMVLMLVCRPKIKEFAALQRSTADSTMLAISRIFAGIKDVKISSNRENFLDSYNNTVHHSAHAAVWSRFWNKLYPSAFILITQIGLILVAMLLWVSGLSGAEIATYLALAMMVSSRLVPSINRIVGSAGALLNVAPFVEGILSFRNSLSEAARLDSEKSDDAVPVRHLSTPKSWDCINIDSIYFQYGQASQPALMDVSLNIRRGKVYGIAGPSGSGKSTLVDILLGLLVANTGKITVDGISLADIDIRAWQEQIGYVPQAPYLLDASLGENVAFCVNQKLLDRDRVKDCIAKAQLWDLMNDLPRGLDTPIGDQGSRLSGGQRQRVAIARALYKGPSLLVMDEATSALDSANEEKINDLIKGLRGVVTTILIAHRISSLREVDEVILLEGGKISAVGSFDELVNRNAGFARMVSLQSQSIPQIL